MTDRNVTQLRPHLEQKLQAPLSKYMEAPNLILLAEPGAGKTHLFRHFARETSGKYITVRAFLNQPIEDSPAPLFIDGLDEKRSGRNDDASIDAVVQKLFEINWRPIRISCRQRDWLSDADSEAFQPYFDANGGSVVLSLDVLSRTEQIILLDELDQSEPEKFLEAAQSRGLEDFLLNPQNLKMLAEAVSRGKWPETRKELFETFTNILLTEHSNTRQAAQSSLFTASELEEPAGLACAARLIGDVEGISLKPNSIDPNFPSYRSLGYQNPDRMEAALTRRAFVSGHLLDTVEYSHRTIAEFLGAKYLSSQIKNGLPLGRALALLGIDGKPTSELRGIHAWLAALLPGNAAQLISSDPFGVLLYGDAGALGPSDRSVLLESLAHLSTQNPWFWSNIQSSPALGALVGVDMVLQFQKFLRSPHTEFSLKALILDALSVGGRLPQMEADLLRIASNRTAAFGLRSRAVDALAALKTAGKKTLFKLYNGLGASHSDIRLRAEIVSEIYGDHLAALDISQLIHDSLACNDALTTGTLWPIYRVVPIDQIAEILDAIAPIERRTRSRAERRNDYEVAIIVDQLMERILTSPVTVDPDQLWRWLSTRRKIRGTYGSDGGDTLKAALSKRDELVFSAVAHYLRHVGLGESKWRVLQKIRENTFHIIDEDHLLELIAHQSNAPRISRDRRTFIYSLALQLSFSGSTKSLSVFARLFDQPETWKYLTTTRDEYLFCPLEQWRLQQARQTAREQNRRTIGKTKSRRDFLKYKASTETKPHFGWLKWIAKVYFALFSDVDGQSTPAERLAAELGNDNVDAAIQRLIDFLASEHVPTLASISTLAAQEKYYEWWYAIVAGMDEAWNANADLSIFSDHLLEAGLAIELLHPVHGYNGGHNQQEERPDWKQAALSQRPAAVYKVYSTIALARLAISREGVQGLSALLSMPQLAPFRTTLISQLLRKYDHLPQHYTDDILRIVIADAKLRVDFLKTADEALKSKKLDNRALWLAAAFLIDEKRFGRRVKLFARNDLSIVWAFRDLVRVRDNTQEQKIGVSQIEYIIQTSGTYFPECGHPAGGWSGDQNDWDAAEFVRAMITSLSNTPGRMAANAFNRLLAIPELSSYSEYLRHASADQKVKTIEFEYLQPTWNQAVSTLKNEAPANIADLHALVISQLRDIASIINSGNTDLYTRFWNEDKNGNVTLPKTEDSCRNVLVDLLRQRVSPLGLRVEPEGHMARQRRSDIIVVDSSKKIVIELKRHYHSKVWSAARDQLDRFYTRDPESLGHGILGVFWYGKRGPKSAPTLAGFPKPASAIEMEEILLGLIPAEARARLEVIVIDVSGDELPLIFPQPQRSSRPRSQPLA